MYDDSSMVNEAENINAAKGLGWYAINFYNASSSDSIEAFITKLKQMHILPADYAQTKNADVGVSATIRGEVWHYMGYENGVVWFEPTVKTIVSSSKTMAQVTVSMECRYNDTDCLMT